MVDRIKQYIREIYYDLKKFEELQREEEFATEELVQSQNLKKD
jgi:hypothetical protein